MNNLSRRGFLKSSAIVVGGSAVGFSSLFGASNVFGQSAGDDPQLMLNLACTAETFASTHYYNAINSAEALGLSAEEVSELKAFLDSELKHKQFLEANGAVTLATEFYVPENLFTDRALFISTSNTAETWFIAAYLAATRRFAELGEPLLAATVAQVLGVEAEHQALIRKMGGLQPSFQTLKRALFYNTSEVGAFFQPFLEGAEGFVGPAPFPGVAEILALVGDEGVINETPFIALTNGMGVNAMSMMTAEATPDMSSGECMVSSQNTNIRSEPNTTSEVVGSLTGNTETAVIGQTQDASGVTWYQIQSGWVRSDVVSATGNCAAVAMVSF